MAQIVLKCVFTIFLFLIISFDPFILADKEKHIHTRGGLEPRVWKGHVASDENTKHQVSLQRSGGRNPFCGGILISSNHVLTAAHCLFRSSEPLKAADIRAVIGKSTQDAQDTSRNTFNVKSYVIHPEYDQDTHSNDIACIHLDRQVPGNDPTMQPIQMIDQIVEEKAICHVAGWGITEKGLPSNSLLQAEVPIVDKKECNEFYKNSLTDGQLCAGFIEGGADACTGDSGGPLICFEMLVGIVSLGSACGKPNKPGVYTDVYFHKKWIHKNLDNKFKVSITVDILLAIVLIIQIAIL